MGSAAPLFEDTVGAIATPAGRGALAVVRLSGAAAGPVLLRLCPSLQGRLPEPRIQRLLAIRHPTSGELLDRGLVSWFGAPASFTGEDVAEISVHGGSLGPQLILDAALAAGVRLAEPGEFTRRAVFHGKLDLLQAEAIADLIDARSLALRRAALNQMDRGLSARVQELRATILELEALLAYEIDFPEEDEPAVPPDQVLRAATDAAERIAELLDTAPQGEMLREGALVVLAGRPNSGKSSLFNALLGVERAIVTTIPGTTRDAIEGAATFDGYPFRLVDTAGLRATHDEVEKIGIEVARRYVDAADVVLFCADADRPLDAEDLGFLSELPGRTVVVLRTKADLHHPAPFSGAGSGSAPTLDARRGPEVVEALEISVSAVDGTGLSSVRAALVQAAFGRFGESAEQPVLTRARHARALMDAHSEILQFIATFEGGIPPELAVTHVRAAAASLEVLLGALTPDDVLGQVFGSFCVGK